MLSKGVSALKLHWFPTSNTFHPAGPAYRPHTYLLWNFLWPGKPCSSHQWFMLSKDVSVLKLFIYFVVINKIWKKTVYCFIKSQTHKKHGFEDEMPLTNYLCCHRKLQHLYWYLTANQFINLNMVSIMLTLWNYDYKFRCRKYISITVWQLWFCALKCQFSKGQLPWQKEGCSFSNNTFLIIKCPNTPAVKKDQHQNKMSVLLIVSISRL